MPATFLRHISRRTSAQDTIRMSKSVEHPCPCNSRDCYRSRGPLAATLLRARSAALIRRRRISSRVSKRRQIRNIRNVSGLFNPSAGYTKVTIGPSGLRNLENTHESFSTVITFLQFPRFPACSVSFFASCISYEPNFNPIQHTNVESISRKR